MLEQFSHKMGEGRKIIGIFSGSKVCPHLILSSLDQADREALAVRRHSEDGWVLWGRKSDLRAEVKEGTIETVLPQRASFDKEEGLYTYVWFLPKQAYILTLFARQGAQEKKSTGSLRMMHNFTQRNTVPISGIGCRRFWSWVQKEDKTARNWVKKRLNSFGCHTSTVGICWARSWKSQAPQMLIQRIAWLEMKIQKILCWKQDLIGFFWIS